MFTPAAIDLAGIKPIKVQPSEARDLEAGDKERDNWIRWSEATKVGHHIGFIRAWKKIPTAEHAEAIIKDAMERELIPLSENIKVTKCGGGSFHAIFKLTLPDWETENVLLRIPIPCDPWYKIESEVANMVFAAYHGVPVPRCLFFDSSANNPLGLEWMILEYVEEAVGLDTQYFIESCRGWARLFNPTLPQGYDLLDEIKKNCQKLEKTRFSQIGSLYCDWETNSFYVGPIIDGEFLDRYTYLFSSGRRGPFDTVEEYLRVVLDVKHQAKLHFANQLSNEGARLSAVKVAEKSFVYREDVMKKLIAVASAHGQTEVAAEDDGPINGSWTYLQHDDLHGGNILMKGTKIKAIIDWEKCNILPHFLRRNHGVPKVNSLFHRARFPQFIISDDAAAVVPPESRHSFPSRAIVKKLLPAPEHVSPLNTVLRLLAAHARKSDMPNSHNEEWANALTTLAEWFSLHTPKDTAAVKAYLASLSDPRELSSYNTRMMNAMISTS